MKAAWLLALTLVVPARADERGIVKEIFRRPEFFWKSEERQPPPTCKTFSLSKKAHGSGGGSDRSGMVEEEAKDGPGLIAPPEVTPGETRTPTRPATEGPPSEVTSEDEVGGTPSDTGTPEGPAVEPTGASTPSHAGTPDSLDSGATPTVLETPSAAVAPEESKSQAGSGLPDHPPPPLDYPVEPGIWERLARWWNRLLGRKDQQGVHGPLTMLRDLLALILIVVFLRQLLPLLRQLRGWFQKEPRPELALEEGSREPEILPEWQSLWRQANNLHVQGRTGQAQRVGYLAVLSYLDHRGDIRYRANLTNREYGSMLTESLREPFRRIVHQFERCRYGGHAPNFEEFQAACREVLG